MCINEDGNLSYTGLAPTIVCASNFPRRKVFKQKRRCREVKTSKIAIYTDALQWFYLSTANVGKM